MTSRYEDARLARENGSRRLSALTIGITAASLMGVGLVAGYDAHLFQNSSASTGTSTGTTGTSTGNGSGTGNVGDDGGSRDDGGGGRQLQTPANPPASTQQQPQAVTGGS